ncbi:MAG: hypothetical protein HYZ89_06200 [Candidatus Omnitrophica bacterium]|nr:hypothetical protein [Candidatus Omnitrophota bacterium]
MSLQGCQRATRRSARASSPLSIARWWTGVAFLLAAGWLLVAAEQAYAAACNASTTGNWSVGTTWTGCTGTGGVPAAADTITINSAVVVTLDVASATVAGLTFAAPGTSNALTHSGTNSLTINGNVTFNQPTTNTRNNAWNINAGSATVTGTVTFNTASTTATRVSKIVITTGSLTINTDLAFSGTTPATKVVDMSGGAGTLAVKGAVTTPSGATLTAGTTSIFAYNGTGAQTIITAWGAGAYNHLHIKPASGSPTKTIATGTLTVQDLVIGDGTNAVTLTAATNNPAITVTGNLTLNASTTFTKGSGTLTLQPTGTKTWTDSNATTQDLGTVSISGGASTPQINLGSSVKATSVRIAAIHTLSANGANTLTLTGTGTAFTVTGTFTYSTGTVEYTGNGATNITGLAGAGGTNGYYNLLINPPAAATHTLQGDTIVNNNLTVNTGDLVGSVSLTVKGGNATGTGSIILSGSSPTNLLNVRSLTTGGGHTCAVSFAGNAYCWGYSGFGGLGDGQFVIDRTTPVRVLKGAAAAADTDGTNLTNIAQLTGGNYHTCAVSNGGNAYCWGYNFYGQLGNNTTTDTATPVRVLKGAAAAADNDATNLTNIAQLTTGTSHTCAVSNAGNAYCWGYAFYGQVGDGQTATNRTTPVRVLKGAAAAADNDGTNLTNIAQLTAPSGSHTCAVSNAGNAYCWGLASSGQLGDNQTATNRTTPVRVLTGASTETMVDSDGVNLRNLRSFSAGTYHTCAVSNAGNAYCWGAAANGQLGNSTTTPDQTTPVRVLKGAAAAADNDGTNLTNIAQLSGGGFHTCAVSMGGNTYGWGAAANGQLGDGQTTTDRTTPVRVLKGAAVTDPMMTLQGAGNFGGNTNWSFFNLFLGDGATTATTTATGTGNVTVSNILTITANHTLQAASKLWILSGGGTPLSVSGILTPQSSTVRYTSTAATTVTGTTYNILELKPSAAGGPTYTLASGTLTTNGALTVGDGTNAVTVTAATNNPALTVTGAFTISASATFTASSSAAFTT